MRTHPTIPLSLISALCLPLSAQDTTAVKASNAFAWDLYRAVASEGKDNVFFSPYSISAALAMTRVGAAGKTAEEMDAVLHTAGAKLGASHRALAKALQPRMFEDGWDKTRKDPAYELQIANRLFGHNGYSFERPFLASLDQQFGATLERVNFKEPETVRARINEWVARQTKQKIKNLVPAGQPTKDTRLALCNAIYFKATWFEQFKTRYTRPEQFTTLDGAEMMTPMMRRTDYFRYAATDDVQVLEIPYLGGDTEMVIVLPKKRDGLPALVKKITPDGLDSWRKAARSKRVALELPRFEFTSTFDLKETLEAMGMREAVDPERADFSGMTKQDRLCIGAVLHKAFIAVDEDGTEAAAATAVMMAVGSAAPIDKPIPFRADHPFLFFIRHKKTGCVLFAGRLMKPEVAKLKKK